MTAVVSCQARDSFWRAGSSANVEFVVPTGNFGNVYAGYAARQMGLPV